MKFTVKRNGNTWGIYAGGMLIEGGYFSAAAAYQDADEMRGVSDSGRFDRRGARS